MNGIFASLDHVQLKVLEDILRIEQFSSVYAVKEKQGQVERAKTRATELRQLYIAASKLADDADATSTRLESELAVMVSARNAAAQMLEEAQVAQQQRREEKNG